MKAKLISNAPGLNIMFRLGGIDTEQVDDENSAREIFERSVKDDNLAVLILTRKIYEDIKKKVDERRSKTSRPLIVVIDGWLEDRC